MGSSNHGPSILATVVRHLTDPPLLGIADAVRPAQEGGVPPEPGFYAWWCELDAVPNGLCAPRHPEDGKMALLYVGIAPRDGASKARLRSRVCRQHIGGNAGSSTFRLALASLLWERQGWHPCLSPSGRHLLPAIENQALSAWQREHLRLRWSVLDEPWRVESAVVIELAAPLNRTHNETHPSHGVVGEARDQFRRAARARGACPK